MYVYCLMECAGAGDFYFGWIYEACYVYNAYD